MSRHDASRLDDIVEAIEAITESLGNLRGDLGPDSPHPPDATPHLTWYNGLRQHQTDPV